MLTQTPRKPDPMTETAADPATRSALLRKVAALLAVCTTATAATVAYFAFRQPPPAPAGVPSAAAPPVPAPAASGGAAATDPSSPGKLGIAKTNCQGFADIAARFWDLRQQGRPIEFVFGAIDENSKGDDGKARVLKALALVVYKDRNATRDVAYRNAHEACMKQ
jgi:hypothetical protein